MNLTLSAISKSKIWANVYGKSSWKKLLANLNKKRADRDPLSVLTILESNGLQDAVWSLQALEGQDQKLHELVCEFLDSWKENDDLAERVRASNGKEAAGWLVQALFPAQYHNSARHLANVELFKRWAAKNAE